MKQKYVDVILPLPLMDRFTYALPEQDEGLVAIGCRVIVPFGKKKYYTAIVVNIHENCPSDYEVKEVLEVLDEKPVLFPVQLKFWSWIASYYLCAEGDVYKAALPAGLKLESETRISYNPDFEAELPLSKSEQLVMDILSVAQDCTITQLERESGLKNVLSVIRTLLNKEAIFIKEELRQAYKPKTEIQVELDERFWEEEQLKFIFNQLNRAPKQLALLMAYVHLANYKSGEKGKPVSKKELLAYARVSTSILNGLIEKGVFKIFSKEIGRLKNDEIETVELNPLNVTQQKGYEEIQQAFKDKSVCLLHGVTSSGKTEVYIQLIQDVLRQGKQVLYLLPEIALTTQITQRLQRVFGNKLGIYHSKYSDSERVEIWNKQLGTERYEIILGVRSSVFLPFQNLGLIIVDEEHENTYKQQDPAPRYHARSAAIMLASMYDAKILLGTATPSIESYYNALNGKYGLVKMTERYQDIKLPEVLPIDIKELIRKKRMKGQLSPFLLEYVRDALEKKDQVILFQNRRGFAPMIECRICGWVPKCKNCDVSLTYHKRINQLTCHYCGYTYPLPKSCPSCGEQEFIARGFGTEKVEDEIKTIFPEANVARMDMDTTRTRNAYEKIIHEFQTGKVNILIGTQMVSKGLDFDHVSVVGILNAGTMLNFPDFRAHERAYQLMAQVAGRAGRKNKRGLVILQTQSLDSPIIDQVIANDYEGMFKTQLAERQLFSYPPYCRLIYIYLKNTKEELVEKMSVDMAERLRVVFGHRVLGPDKPPVGRVQTLYIKKIVLKIEQGASLIKVRQELLRVQKNMENEFKEFRSIKLYYDVDPM